MAAEGQANEKIRPTGLDLLRAPFPANQVSKLPKETRQQIDERKAGKNTIRCTICNGYHHKNAVHIDYVGHAAVTDRLLDADLGWSWEPLAFGPDGLPMMDKFGGLWINLTVCGMTRKGYGHPDGKTGGDAIKEAIGDALRNAALRFGAALEMWHKGDLHAAPDPAIDEIPASEDDAQPGTKANSRELFETLVKGLRACRSSQHLREWGAAFADDIKKLPTDWANEIRAEYRAEMNAHMDNEVAEEHANVD